MRLSLVAIGVTASLAARADTAKTVGGGGVVDRVVAIVNDSVILDSELAARMRALHDDVMAIPDPGERTRRLAKLESQMLDSMINDELVVQAAKAAHVTVDDSEVKVAMDYIREQHHLTEEQLREAMAAQGLTPETYRLDLLRQRTINMVLGPKIKITPEDIQARYNEMKSRAEQVTAVELSHIQIKLSDHPTEQERNDAITKAQDAIARVKAGESFADVAKAVSDDATTKNTGGALGWVQSGTIPTEWEKIVFTMDKGDLRGPTVGAQGVEVFYATETKRTPIQPFAELKKELSDGLERQQLAKLTTTWIESLRKTAYVDIRLK